MNEDLDADDGLGPAPELTAAAVPQRRYLVADSPWRGADFLRSASIVFLGYFGVCVCWFGISGENTFRDQVGWLVGSMGAAGFFAVGMTSWLLAGFREVRRGQREVFNDLRTVMELEDVTPPATHLPEPDIDRIGGVSAFEHLVTGEGMTLVHASRCLLVKGKDVRPVGVRDLEKLGLDRCGVCLR